MILAAALLFSLQTSPTPPVQTTTACKATDATLPVALLGWTKPQDMIEPGKAVLIDTVDAATLKGLPAGSKPGKAALVSFTVTSAGTYGIALDQPGWIDVLPGATGGEPLKSTAHGHGPECSTIRKIVRFTLEPGSYRLALSGLNAPKAKVMLVSGG